MPSRASVVEALVAMLLVLAAVAFAALAAEPLRCWGGTIALVRDWLWLLAAHLEIGASGIFTAELAAFPLFALARGPHARNIRVESTLLNLLLAIGEDDPVVVLGVLEIILSQDWISGRLRIARQGDVFLGDMRGIAADLHFRAVRLVAARQRVLAFSVMLTVAIVVVVMAAAAAPILLSLPHGLLCSTARCK
jgi:hypothetical protein